MILKQQMMFKTYQIFFYMRIIYIIKFKIIILKCLKLLMEHKMVILLWNNLNKIVEYCTIYK